MLSLSSRLKPDGSFEQALSLKGTIREIERELKALSAKFGPHTQMSQVVEQVVALKGLQCPGWQRHIWSPVNKCSNLILNGDFICNTCTMDKIDHEYEMMTDGCDE